MTDRDIAGVVKAAHAFWNEADDPEAMFDLLWHPELEWTEPPTSPNAGTFRGRQAVIDYLRGWIESIGPSRHAIEEQVVADDLVMSAVRLSVRGPMSGVGFDAPLYFVERVRAGRIDRVRVFYDRATALAALDPSQEHDTAET